MKIALPHAQSPGVEPLTRPDDLFRAIGYVTPKDKLEGRAESIFAERDRKLAEARERRKANRPAQRPLAGLTGLPTTTPTGAEDRATLGTDPSADSGAKTEWGGTTPPSAIRDWHSSDKSTVSCRIPSLTPADNVAGRIPSRPKATRYKAPAFGVRTSNACPVCASHMRHVPSSDTVAKRRPSAPVNGGAKVRRSAGLVATEL